MRVNPKELIAGRPIRDVRDFLRAAKERGFFTFEHVRRSFGADITAELLRRDLIESVSERDRKKWSLDAEAFRLTKGPGVSLSNALLIPRINREKAERIVADFLNRVDDVNGHDDLLHFVAEVRVFGSYITKAADLGDIDLAVRLVRRHPGTGWAQRNFARAEASGLSLNWHQQLSYGETEVWRLLKARNPYLQIWRDWPEFMSRKIKSEVLRKFDPSGPTKLTIEGGQC